jgi:hypothetical protein
LISEGEKEEEPEIVKMKILTDEIKKQPEDEESKLLIRKQKNKVIKNLVDDLSKKMLIKCFNIWKIKTPKVDDEEILKRTARKSIIHKRIINLQKKVKEGEPEIEEPKKYNMELPICPIETTLNTLQSIRNPVHKHYDLDELNSIPKEPLLKTRIPEKRLYPEIYEQINKTKKDLDFHLEFLKQVPHHTFNKIMPQKMLNMMKEMHTNLALMKVFYIYTHYKTDKFFVKKSFWNRWKKNTLIFNSEDISEIHLTNITGHCFSMERIVIREVRCGLHHDSLRYTDCLCLRTRLCLKRILLRHYFMRYIDRRRYYLYRWYKNTFRRIRFIYL